MKDNIIETGFCPECEEPLIHGEIIRFNNSFHSYLDVISQDVTCGKCKIDFEVIFVPVKIIKTSHKEDYTKSGGKDGY